MSVIFSGLDADSGRYADELISYTDHVHVGHL